MRSWLVLAVCGALALIGCAKEDTANAAAPAPSGKTGEAPAGMSAPGGQDAQVSRGEELQVNPNGSETRPGSKL